MMKLIKEIPGAYIADSACVMGDVEIGEDTSVWYNAVIRGDEGKVRIGKRCSIQDCAVIHMDLTNDVIIGDDVTVGHGAIVHGCTVGNNTLIGMGATILNGAKIGNNCLIGAGALVTQNAVIPDGTMAMGIAAKVKREMTEADLEINREDIEKYIRNAKMHFT